MRRLAALIIGVATAQPDMDAACRRPTYPDRYVVMLSAFEQMNKNIGVVAEAASWAKKLGRTFVEPLYCRSRVAPPFAAVAETGLALAVRVRAAHDLRGVDWTCRGQAKVPLSAARDVRQACKTVPMISAAAFLARLERRPALRNSTALITQGTKNKRFSNIQRLQRGKAILYVAGLHRHISYSQIAQGYCVARPCFGIQFGAAPRLVEDARRAAAAARPYTCVNVRTEWVLSESNLLRCPARIHDAARRAWAALPGARATTLVVSDIFAETSGTYRGKSQIKAAMRDKLETLLFGNVTRRRLVAVAGPRKGPIEALLAKRVPGSSTAAITEQLLCAAADTVVMCTSPMSCSCGHGLQSGFVSTIKWFRAGAFGRSTRSNVAGGLFSY